MLRHWLTHVLYPYRNYTVPIVSVYNTVHCIATVLLNNAILYKIDIDVDTYIIFVTLLFIKILYNKLELYVILTVSWHYKLSV